MLQHDEAMTQLKYVYEVRPRKDHRGVDLISDVLPFGRLWYSEANAVSNAVGYALHYSRSHHAVIRVYDDAGNMIKTHEHNGDFVNALAVKEVYAPKRKQDESEHWLHDQSAANPRRVLCAPASDRDIAGLLPSRSVNESFPENVDIRTARILSARD